MPVEEKAIFARTCVALNMLVRSKDPNLIIIDTLACTQAITLESKAAPDYGYSRVFHWSEGHFKPKVYPRLLEVKSRIAQKGIADLSQ